MQRNRMAACRKLTQFLPFDGYGTVRLLSRKGLSLSFFGLNSEKRHEPPGAAIVGVV